MRARYLIPIVLMLAACGHAPIREHSGARRVAISSGASAAPVDACAPTRVHRDSDYTAGGLYAPEVSDGEPSAPIDVSGLPEPVPRDEPLSRYGNRSPYTVLGQSYRVLERAEGYVERGTASWYGTKFNGRATSSGELYSICSFTAAHKTLPLPTFARVTNLDNGRSVIVRINDRGPFHSDRLIDLSYAAAVRLGVDRTGTARVEVRAISGGSGDAGPAIAGAKVESPVRQMPVGAGGVGLDRGYVQVGSFAVKDNAKRVADRLQDAGIDDVDLDHAEVDGLDVWRVKVGPVRPEKFSSLIDKIRSLGFSGARVFSE